MFAVVQKIDGYCVRVSDSSITLIADRDELAELDRVMRQSMGANQLKSPVYGAEFRINMPKHKKIIYHGNAPFPSANSYIVDRHVRVEVHARRYHFKSKLEFNLGEMIDGWTATANRITIL